MYYDLQCRSLFFLIIIKYYYYFLLQFLGFYTAHCGCQSCFVITLLTKNAMFSCTKCLTALRCAYLQRMQLYTIALYHRYGLSFSISPRLYNNAQPYKHVAIPHIPFLTSASRGLARLLGRVYGESQRACMATHCYISAAKLKKIVHNDDIKL